MPLAPADFSISTDVYDRIRPNYMRSQVDKVLAMSHVTPNDVVVDMGSGTGKLARMFISEDPAHPYCKQVISLERSEADGGMVGECAKNMARFGERAQVVTGKAESTGLPDKSVKLIVAGDAAHWFDPPEPVSQEFKRILADDGKVAIFVRYPDPTSDIVKELNKGLLEKCRTYSARHGNRLIDEPMKTPEGEEEKLGLLEKKKGMHLVAKESSQTWQEPLVLKWTKEDLIDYLKSRSSTNTWAKSPDNKEALDAIIDPIFAKHAHGDTIDFPYTCNVLTGSLREYEKTQVTSLKRTPDDGGIV